MIADQLLRIYAAQGVKKRLLAAGGNVVTAASPEHYSSKS